MASVRKCKKIIQAAGYDWEWTVVSRGPYWCRHRVRLCGFDLLLIGPIDYTAHGPSARAVFNDARKWVESQVKTK